MILSSPIARVSSAGPTCRSGFLLSENGKSIKPEAKVTKAIRNYLKPLETTGQAFVVKIAGGPRQRAGLPDLLILYRGRAVWLEIKAPGENPTPLQEATLRRIRNAGGIGECVRSAEEVRAIIERIDAGIYNPF